MPLSAQVQTSALPSTAAPAPLPPEAQDALKKGVIAAQQQDYLLAIGFFQDARKIAPDASQIYLDLGLAESKIPGRELRAICWFEAYLAANPNAPNAAAVKVQIHTLDVNNTSNFSRLVKSMQDATNQLVNRGTEYDLNLAVVAVYWEDAGDMKAALKTVGLIRNADSKNQALVLIAITSAGTGDIPGAQAVADLIEPAHSKDGALHSIAAAQAGVGEITAALKTANLIQDATEK
jgi:tetratricopeptide (TPR) repeat protein